MQLVPDGFAGAKQSRFCSDVGKCNFCQLLAYNNNNNNKSLFSADIFWTYRH
jgi:hypothetical protein